MGLLTAHMITPKTLLNPRFTPRAFLRRLIHNPFALCFFLFLQFPIRPIASLAPYNTTNIPCHAMPPA
jgi:hypothetical protein